MKYKWTTEHELEISEEKFQEVAATVRAGDKSVNLAVNDFLDWMDEDVYYNITNEIVQQIRDEVRKRV